MRDGGDAVIFATGFMVWQALEAAQMAARIWNMGKVIRPDPGE